MGCHFLLQGIFLTQASNPGLLHHRQILYWLSDEGSPLSCMSPLYILEIKPLSIALFANIFSQSIDLDNYSRLAEKATLLFWGTYYPPPHSSACSKDPTTSKSVFHIPRFSSPLQTSPSHLHPHGWSWLDWLFLDLLTSIHTMDKPHHLPSHKLFLNLKPDWLTLAPPLPAPQPSHSLSPTLLLLMLISFFQAISPFLASHSSPGSLHNLIHPSFTPLIFTPIFLVKPSPGFHWSALWLPHLGSWTLPQAAHSHLDYCLDVLVVPNCPSPLHLLGWETSHLCLSALSSAPYLCHLPSYSQQIASLLLDGENRSHQAESPSTSCPLLPPH